MPCSGRVPDRPAGPGGSRAGVAVREGGRLLRRRSEERWRAELRRSRAAEGCPRVGVRVGGGRWCRRRFGGSRRGSELRRDRAGPRLRSGHGACGSDGRRRSRRHLRCPVRGVARSSIGRSLCRAGRRRWYLDRDARCRAPSRRDPVPDDPAHGRAGRLLRRRSTLRCSGRSRCRGRGGRDDVDGLQTDCDPGRVPGAGGSAARPGPLERLRGPQLEGRGAAGGPPAHPREEARHDQLRAIPR